MDAKSVKHNPMWNGVELVRRQDAFLLGHSHLTGIGSIGCFMVCGDVIIRSHFP